MAQDNTLRVRYSELVEKKLRKNTVFSGLFNHRYEGTPTAGAVKIPVRGEVAVDDEYDEVAGGTLTHSTTSYVTLVTDKKMAVNELCPGYASAAQPGNIVADKLDSAGYGLGKTTDDYLVATLLADGNATASKNGTDAISADNIYSFIVKDVQAAKKLGLSVDELWLAVTNDAYEAVLNSPKFTAASALGDGTVVNGLIGKIAGVKVVETNNIPDTANVDYILGNNVFCHEVDEWEELPAVNKLADGKHIGAYAVQGLKVAGAKISKPTTVFVKKHA